MSGSRGAADASPRSAAWSAGRLVARAALAACAKAPEPASPRANVAVPYTLTSLDPHREASRASALLYSAYEALLDVDAALKPRAGLAESWSNIDERTWVFRLREGVRFHDGAPLRAADVAFTLRRLLSDRDLESGYYLTDVSDVRASDERTVVASTDDVTGWVEVADGEASAARVEVRTATLATGSAVQDRVLRRALEVDVFPTAVFTLTSPLDVAQVEETDEPVELEARGTLTILGETQPVTVALEAQRSGEGVQLRGAIGVQFSDYGVVVPSEGLVVVRMGFTPEADDEPSEVQLVADAIAALGVE